MDIIAVMLHIVVNWLFLFLSQFELSLAEVEVGRDRIDKVFFIRYAFSTITYFQLIYVLIHTQP